MEEETVTTTKRGPGESDLWNGRRKRVREVAEITLALAAMVEMRKEKGPSEAETEMMEKARGKLAELCAGFSPKEVFPVDKIGKVIEDLGIGRSKEEEKGLGFRVPAKLSIGEKVLYTKQQFEKTEAAESRGAAHTTNVFPSDRTRPVPVSSGVLPTGHAANSASLPYQLPASEVRKPLVSSGLPNSLSGKDTSLSLPHKQYRLDQRPNGLSYTPQVQANIPGSRGQPAWSQHPQPSSLAKPGAFNKIQNPVKSEGNIKAESTAHTAASRTASQAAGRRPLMNQHMHKTNVQISSNTHSEISKVVQKFLQSHLPKRAACNPQSRDYMNKSVTCLVCKVDAVEVENVLLCDACEGAYHMKCLQAQDLKTIPRGEWHCSRCLALTDGKPLPPKYGRVTRNITAPKAAPKAALLSYPEKKARISNDQAHQQKLVANGSRGIKSTTSGIMVNTSSSASNSSAPNATAMQGVDKAPSSNDKSAPVSRQNEDVLKVATTPI